MASVFCDVEHPIEQRWEELVPKLLTLGEVGRVLEQLLRERVSIRDLGTILEAMLETAAGRTMLLQSSVHTGSRAVIVTESAVVIVPGPTSSPENVGV